LREIGVVSRETVNVLLDDGNTARAALMSSVLQGAALWRALDPADTRIQANKGAKRTAIYSRMRLTVRAQWD
jgi:hypothetical protein